MCVICNMFIVILCCLYLKIRPQIVFDQARRPLQALELPPPAHGTVSSGSDLPTRL